MSNVTFSSSFFFFFFFFSQKVAVPSIHISNSISKFLWQSCCKYCEHNYLIKHACLFYSFKLRHHRQVSERGHSFVILLSRCITYNLSIFNRRTCVQRIRKNFWVSCRNFGELHSCVLEISPFFALLYTFCVTRGHDMSTLARRLRVRSKSDIFENYNGQIQIFFFFFFSLVKMVYAIIWFMKLKYVVFFLFCFVLFCFLLSTTCSPVRFSVVTQHLTPRQKRSSVFKPLDLQSMSTNSNA